MWDILGPSTQAKVTGSFKLCYSLQGFWMMKNRQFLLSLIHFVFFVFCFLKGACGNGDGGGEGVEWV